MMANDTDEDKIDNKSREPSVLVEEDAEPSQHVAALQFWCTFTAYPVAFCLLNYIVLSIIVKGDHETYAHRLDDALAKFGTACAYLAALLLLDSFVLFRATGSLEKLLDALSKKEIRQEPQMMTKTNTTRMSTLRYHENWTNL